VLLEFVYRIRVSILCRLLKLRECAIETDTTVNQDHATLIFGI